MRVLPCRAPAEAGRVALRNHVLDQRQDALVVRIEVEQRQHREGRLLHRLRRERALQERLGARHVADRHERPREPRARDRR